MWCVRGAGKSCSASVMQRGPYPKTLLTPLIMSGLRLWRRILNIPNRELLLSFQVRLPPEPGRLMWVEKFLPWTTLWPCQSPLNDCRPSTWTQVRQNPIMEHEVIWHALQLQCIFLRTPEVRRGSFSGAVRLNSKGFSESWVGVIAPALVEGVVK